MWAQITISKATPKLEIGDGEQLRIKESDQAKVSRNSANPSIAAVYGWIAQEALSPPTHYLLLTQLSWLFMCTSVGSTHCGTISCATYAIRGSSVI
jgi:hypothetical protein